MDLGAFLQPGRYYPVTFTPEGEGADSSENAQGYLIGRGRNRCSWLSPAPYPPGRLLSLSVSLIGFQLDARGDLDRTPAPGPEPGAPVTLLGQVRNLHPLKQGELFVLRVDLIGRITERRELMSPR